MIKLYGVVLLCYVCLIAYLLTDVGNASSAQYRPKRFLSFQNFSHFFLRLNFKANIIPWNQIFAQALGYRVNWDDPTDSFHPYHHINRRSLYTHLEVLLDRNGLNGYHCVRRAICEIETVSESREIYHRILKMVFRRQSSATAKWHDVAQDKCHSSIFKCPFSVLDIARFTDV